MFQRIRKRDGRIVEFDLGKTTSAIARAGKAAGELGQDEARRLTVKVLSWAHDSLHGSVPEVEEIQDLVGRVLLDSPFHRTAKAYILYHDQHAQIRNLSEAANVDLVERYLLKQDWRVMENNNIRRVGLENVVEGWILGRGRVSQSPKTGFWAKKRAG
jgi:anaerobic ribonucleoside-triphosphate reductase